MYAFTPSEKARITFQATPLVSIAASFCSAARGMPSSRVRRSSGSARAPTHSVSRPDAACVCRSS